MAVVTQFDPGFFCWADLATSELELAKVFYTELFGWSTQELPTDGEMPYVMFLKNATPVCAIYEMNDENSEEFPPYWQSYIAVDDVDAVAQKALELGAETLMEPFDVMQAGRMALLQDPEGAIFALWKSFEAGAVMIQENGAIGWNELYVEDTANAEKFYTALFGWQSMHQGEADTVEYTEFKHHDASVGGMLEIQEEWEEVLPHWAVYFQIDNLEEKMERVKNLGGSIASDIMVADNVGEFVVVQDPQGAHFLIIELFA